MSQTSVSDKCLESAENQLSFGEIKYNVPVKDDESSSYVLLNLVFGERGNIQSANQRKSFADSVDSKILIIDDNFALNLTAENFNDIEYIFELNDDYIPSLSDENLYGIVGRLFELKGTS